MSDTMAKETAESYAQGIWADHEAGYLFGVSQDRMDAGEEYELTAYDWLEDALDIEYRVGSDKQYRSAKIMIGCGGPNVWVDTAAEQIIVAWYSAPVALPLPAFFCEQLDEALSEIFTS